MHDGRAIHDRCDKVQLATKIVIDGSGGRDIQPVRGDVPYVGVSCGDSLLRLGVDVIDLYHLHRLSQNAEIEATIGATADLGWRS